MTSFRYLTLSFATLTLIGSVGAFADDAPAAPPPPQDTPYGKAQIGYQDSKGNTDATSANANIDMFLLHDPWKHEVYLAGVYGKAAGIVSAERWEAKEQTNYNFSKDMFVFGEFDELHDMFSGFRYQWTLSTGVGWNLINTPTTKLTTQVGGGYSKLQDETLVYGNPSNSSEVTGRTFGATEGYGVVTAGLNFSQVLTKTTTVTDKFSIESGNKNTLTQNDLALQVKMSTKLAVSLGYSIINNSSPTSGQKKLNTMATANLVYSF